MTDFKGMYLRLLNQVARAANVLQWAQWEGEEAYIDSDVPSIIQLFKNEWEDGGTYTFSVLGGGYSSPAIMFRPPWLTDMGFISGALVQVLPEAGGMFFILCDENIRRYSELLRATEEKKGTLITVSYCSTTGALLEIEGQYIRNAGLDVGDHLIARSEYGLIRVRKLSEQLGSGDPSIIQLSKNEREDDWF